MPYPDPFADPREIYGVDIPELTPRQQAAAEYRAKLQGTIESLESEGYKVPHFIGRENEPEGDRGPTMDIESLLSALRQKQVDAIKAGNNEKAVNITKDMDYWDNEIKTKGMSAEQWRKQTGEDDPVR